MAVAALCASFLLLRYKLENKSVLSFLCITILVLYAGSIVPSGGSEPSSIWFPVAVNIVLLGASIALGVKLRFRVRIVPEVGGLLVGVFVVLLISSLHLAGLPTVRPIDVGGGSCTGEGKAPTNGDFRLPYVSGKSWLSIRPLPDYQYHWQEFSGQIGRYNAQATIDAEIGKAREYLVKNSFPVYGTTAYEQPVYNGSYDLCAGITMYFLIDFGRIDEASALILENTVFAPSIYLENN
ncbi:MAG: hypothetical protein ACREAY_10705 [Nitrososphaera sp.]|uniref:hypothetical protein n=1 Tax=Nitrososphaera sp. TaxID=1971748 RepID=UPI003D6DED1F